MYFNDAKYKTRMYSMQLFLDESILSIKREPKNLGNALSSVGGLSSVIALIFLKLASLISKYSFENEVIAKQFFKNDIKKVSRKSFDERVHSQIEDYHKNNKFGFFSFKDLLILKVTSICPCIRTRRLAILGRQMKDALDY